jgi:hypothetical protein
MSNSDETVLWRRDHLECVMVSCCAGAELQLRQHAVDSADQYQVVLRELYPSKSDLFERSRLIREQHVQRSPSTVGEAAPLSAKP